VVRRASSKIQNGSRKLKTKNKSTGKLMMQ